MIRYQYHKIFREVVDSLSALKNLNISLCADTMDILQLSLLYRMTNISLTEQDFLLNSIPYCITKEQKL